MRRNLAHAMPRLDTRGNIRLFGVRPQHGFLARKGKAAALFV